MARTAAKITQADISRVLRAVEKSGMRLAVEISPDGSIRLEPADTRKPATVDSGSKWVP